MQFREVAASLYPWDLLDEGVENVLDTLQRDTLTNSTYLVSLMHDEKRPLTDFYYPHNPRRKTYWTEDSRAYWKPSPASYADSKIKPRTTENTELQGEDWLATLIDASRRRGMTVGAELSHTWIDKERAAGEFQDCVQHTIDGSPLDQQICFNNPDVVAYAKSLYLDLARNYDIDYIMTCVRGFNAGPPPRGDNPRLENLAHVALGGCFCSHCEASATSSGLDWSRLVAKLRWFVDGFRRNEHQATFDLDLLFNSSMSEAALLLEVPELASFLKFREDSLTRFFGEIYRTVKCEVPQIDLRLNHFSRQPELMGLDLKAVSQCVDSVRSSDYSEQSGDPGRMEWKRRYLHSIRHAIGLDKYMLSAVSPRPKATPDLVEKGVQISAECGSDALTIGHYDGAWMPCLRAVKTGLEKADVTVTGPSK